jgi:hypothetical protein
MYWVTVVCFGGYAESMTCYRALIYIVGLLVLSAYAMGELFVGY